MNVVFVHRLGPQMASFRYRTQVPVEQLKALGWNAEINNGEADVVVFSKPIAEDVKSAKALKAEGAKIVVDMCDDHFNDIKAPTYREFAEIADGIVCGSTVMRGRIFDYVKRDSVAITDPYEFPECDPHADGDHYLWFGHQRNFGELAAVTGVMGDRKLRVVSGPKPAPQVIPWSPENLAKAFSISNIVVLPTKPGAEYKSPNRLINTIRAGCFPVCMKHPAYLDFKHLVWVGHFPTGLRWAEAFRGDLNGLVKEAQDYIRDRYSPQTIGAQWAAYLQSL